MAWTAEDDAVTAAMRDALYAEEVKGDPATALKAYEAVTARFEEQRDLAATALFRQAECLRKLNRPQDAAAVYRKVLLLFPDKDRLARLSRENLTALGEKAPDTLPAAASGDPTITEEEQKQLARVKAMAANSPDLVFQTTDNSYGPFFAAAKDGHAAVLEWLLTTHPDEAKPHLTTALRDAVTFGQLKACGKLIAAGATLDGMLSRALQNQRWSVFRLLLASKADPNEDARVTAPYRGTDGTLNGSLLVQALGGRRSVPTDILADILKAGVDANKPGTFSFPNGGETLSLTPLGLAVQSAPMEMVRLLLQSKADVNQPSGANGQTPLIIALRERPEPEADPVVEALVAAGADWTIRSTAGDTALHLAASGGYEKWVEAALKAGVDPNAKANDGQTPLIYAQQGRNGYRVVSRLLGAGATLEAPQKNENWFAYACATWPENPEALAAMAALVKAGASVDEPMTKANWAVGPPLQAALSKNLSFGLKTVEFLLGQGARPKATEVLTKTIPRWTSTADFEALLAVFRPLWQAANWRDNPQLPNAIWFDDGEAFLEKKRRNGDPASIAPQFAAVFSRESALDGSPSLKQAARDLAVYFSTLGRDWTKATINRRREDGGVSVLPSFDIVAIAEGKAEAPALQWGDVLSLAAGEGPQDPSYEPVKAWANAEPAFTVRIDLGEAGVVTNRTNAEAQPLWDVKMGGQPPDLNTLIVQAGVPRDFLRLEPVVRRPGADGVLSSITPYQTGNQNVVLRHGDIVAFSAPKPKDSLTADELRGGVWLAEAEGGPFWPVNPTLKNGDRPSFGYLLLALQAPQPGPFQSIDWSKARFNTDGSTGPLEPFPAEFEKLPIAPGLKLVLPRGESAVAQWPESVRQSLGRLGFDWNLRKADGGVSLPRAYRPRLFNRRLAGGKVVWADASPEGSAGPLLPRLVDLFYSDSAIAGIAGAAPAPDPSVNWVGNGMEILWGITSQSPSVNVAPSAQPPQRKRVVLPSQ